MYVRFPIANNGLKQFITRNEIIMYPFLFLIIGGILLIILIAAALYNGIVIRRYAIDSEKLKSGQSLTIALITDLHNTKHENLIELTRDSKPDLIALAGDIIDTSFPKKMIDVENFLDDIASLDIPVFYVTGNHEIGALGTNKIKNDIRRRGIAVLEDEFIITKINGVELIIAGVDDPYKNEINRWKKQIAPNLTDVNKHNYYKIMLAHRPDLWQIYYDMGLDLVLSGHAHGGQVRIPFLINGLFAPHQGFFPKYAGGLYDHKGMKHVVSRGLSKFINLPRIFNPPELVVITISNYNQS